LNFRIVKLLSLYIFYLTLIISCKSKEDHFSNCAIPYTLNTLFKNYDSSRFEISNNDGWTLVRDKGNIRDNDKDKDKGLYSFDQNSILRSYTFLVDDSTFQFGVTFDSLGRESKKSGNNVVRWSIYNRGNDSSRITFLVFQINRSYGSIKISLDHDTMPVKLFESRYYSNLAGGEITVSNQSGGLIHLTGRMRDDCTGKLVNLKEFIDVSNELLR
jgi:hypothetical protein